MSSLLDTYPHINNLQTRTQALGMALYGYSIHYLSTAGAGTACKSIWSSLVSPRGTLDCQPWGYNLSGASGLQTAYQTLPNSNFQHMVTLVKQANFLVCVDPQAAQLHDELEIEHVEQRCTLLEQRMPEILDSFIAYLNAETDVPVIPAWGDPLWRAGLKEGGIQPLECFGDCLSAWLVSDDFDWLGLVQSLLRRGDLRFDVQAIAATPTPLVADAQQMSFLVTADSQSHTNKVVTP